MTLTCFGGHHANDTPSWPPCSKPWLTAVTLYSDKDGTHRWLPTQSHDIAMEARRHGGSPLVCPFLFSMLYHVWTWLDFLVYIVCLSPYWTIFQDFTKHAPPFESLTRFKLIPLFNAGGSFFFFFFLRSVWKLPRLHLFLLIRQGLSWGQNVIKHGSR